MSNAHPLLDCQNEVVVVHNGIVENYLEIKNELLDQGHTFSSETDSEVIPAPGIEDFMERGATAGRGGPTGRTPFDRRPRGGGDVQTRTPESSLLSGCATPVASWWGTARTRWCWPATCPPSFPTPGRSYSSPPARWSRITGSSADLRVSGRLRRCTRPPSSLPYDAVSVAKGGYSHFMMKEIMEQPQASIATLRGRISLAPPDVSLDGLEPDADADIAKTQQSGIRGDGHQLQRRAGRPAHDGAAQRPAVGSGGRLRVQVQRPNPGLRRAGGIHRPVRRDCRHPLGNGGGGGVRARGS